MTRVHLALVANLLALQQPAMWRAVDFRGAGNQAVDSSACRWDSGGASVFRRTAGNRLEVLCDAPVPAATLHCDVPGHESRDVRLADMCQAPVVRLDAGALGRVDTALTPDVGVTWFRWADSPAPEIRAERHAANASTFAILAAPASFVRFTLNGFSPVTTSAATLAAGPWTLRSPGGGGELFARHQAGRVVAEAIEIVGPQAQTVSILEGWFSRPDLSEGTYTLTRVYPGGLKTKPVSASIQAGRSTDAWLPLETVGGLNIIAEGSACELGDRLEVLRYINPQQPPSAVGQTTECSWRVGGLPPGPYLVRVRPTFRDAPDVTVATDVKTQEWTDVRIVGPAIVVHGQVMVLGQPAAGLELTFGRIGDVPDMATAIIKPNGHYAVGLANPGPYETALHTPLNTRFEKTSFEFGDNTYDIRVKGGRIIVSFPNPPARPPFPPEDANLWVDGPSGKSTAHFSRGSESVVITVYEYGRYGIGGYALTGPNKGLPATRYQTVDISEATPRAGIQMMFAQFSQELEVVDTSGRRLLDAAVVMPSGPAPPMAGRGGGLSHLPIRGLFSTINFRLPPDTPIQIESGVLGSGLGRSCHVLTTAPRDQAIVTQSVAQVELRFPRNGDDLSGMVSGIPGATCPVPLSRFSSQRSPGVGYESVRVMLPLGTLVLERDGQKYVIRVPGSAVAIK